MRFAGTKDIEKPFKAFSTIDLMLRADNLSELNAMVMALQQCSHPHNYMVQQDGLLLFTTPLGAQCITHGQ